MTDVSRRAFLRSTTGAMIALPWASFALSGGRLIAATEGQAPPKRLFTYWINNGFPEVWWNYGSGLDALGDGTKSKITLLTGLDTGIGANMNHHGGTAALFTGKKFADHNTAGGPSLDQFAAAQLAGTTTMPSLTVGLRHFRPEQKPLMLFSSWDAKGRPVPQYVNPRDVFKRLYGTPKKESAPSVLDAVMEMYKSSRSDSSGLGTSGRAALDEHLESVRELEQRTIELEKQIQACQVPKAPDTFPAQPDQITYEQFGEVAALHFELIKHALACDLTRFGSLMFGCSGEVFSIPGMSNTEHNLAHGVADPKLRAEFLGTRKRHARLLKQFLKALDSGVEGDGTLLDHTIVLAGSEFNIPLDAAGNSVRIHDTSRQAHMVCGGAGMKVGTVLDLQGKKTTSDLYRTCLKALDPKLSGFGEGGDGVIGELLP